MLFVLFFMWIYLGCFCAVYKKIQIHLLFDVLSSFGFSFIIVGVLLYFIMYVETSDLYKTSRKLSDSDLEGLRKDDLEKLICRIYAIHGYDFNVNDGLFYLPKLMTKFKQLFPGAYHIKESELGYYSNKLGCSIEQLVIILEKNINLSVLDIPVERE